jgi:hypothetical protein
MTDPSKIKSSHTQRAAYVYIRQSRSNTIVSPPPASTLWLIGLANWDGPRNKW